MNPKISKTREVILPFDTFDAFAAQTKRATRDGWLF